MEPEHREPDWLYAVVAHDSMKLAEPSFKQTWVLVFCTHECVNAGPWRVFVGPGERFFCSACGREMRHQEET